MSATNKKTEIEQWKQNLVTTTRRSQEQLVEQNMAIISEMKQVSKQFGDFSQVVGGKQKKDAQ